MAAARKNSRQQSVTDQLRSAVKRTFDATVGEGFSRERAQDLVDEVTDAADRWGRGAVEELRRVAGDELSNTRKRIDQLEKRLAELEGRVRPKAAAKPSAATKSKPAAKPKTVAKPKPAAKPKAAAARKPAAAAKPAAKRKTTAAAKPKKPTAAKPKAPAASRSKASGASS